MQWRGGMVCLKGLLVLLSLLSANSLRVPFHSNGQREGGPLFLEASGANEMDTGRRGRGRQEPEGRSGIRTREADRQEAGGRQVGPAGNQGGFPSSSARATEPSGDFPNGREREPSGRRRKEQTRNGERRKILAAGLRCLQPPVVAASCGREGKQGRGAVAGRRFRRIPAAA